MSELDNSIRIFPNPNNGNFTVKSSRKLDIILITNILGQDVVVVKPKSSSELIDLTDKPKGVYIVKLRLENHDRIIRVIKN